MPRIVSIVEGDGEIQAFPVLLRRAVGHLCPPDLHVEIPRPLRLPRGKLDREDEFTRMIQLSSSMTNNDGAVFILMDADDECPATKGPEILERAKRIRGDCHFSVVLANKEYESWFIASASSLAGRKGFPEDLVAPGMPEGIRDAKGWIANRLPRDRTYSPTVDQPSLSALIDLEATRKKSCSFDKFMREVEKVVCLFKSTP